MCFVRDSNNSVPKKFPLLMFNDIQTCPSLLPPIVMVIIIFNVIVVCEAYVATNRGPLSCLWTSRYLSPKILRETIGKREADVYKGAADCLTVL